MKDPDLAFCRYILVGHSHLNLKGAPLEFLLALKRLDYKHHVCNKIEDPHTRMVAARCLEKERSELLRATYTDSRTKS